MSGNADVCGRAGLPAGAVAISHGGESLWLLRERGAYWVERSTLLIADVHLGKAEAMRASGVAVPIGVGDESLERISRAALVTGARRVIVLGDLLHAPVGVTAGLVERVSRWRTTLDAELCLVPGNHDRAAERVVGAWGIRLLGAVHEEGGLTLTHVPPDLGADGTPGVRGARSAFVAGHVHPALSVRTGRGPGKVACFHLSGACGSTLVLHAFSRFTRGASLRCARGGAARLFAATDEGVLEA